jgi:hypothetical protein
MSETFLEAVREDDARLLSADGFAALKRDQIGGVLRPTPVPGAHQHDARGMFGSFPNEVKRAVYTR